MAVRTAMEHPIGALPRTPFCHYVAFPLKGKREIWREKQGVIYFMYHFGVFPLWWLAPPPFSHKRGHYKAPLCCERLMKGMLHGVLFCPLNRGKSGAARIGSGERSEPISRIVFMSFDTESKLRNADFISIAAERQSATLGAKGPVKLKNPWARKGPSILRTLFPSLLHNLPT